MMSAQELLSQINSLKTLKAKKQFCFEIGKSNALDGKTITNRGEIGRAMLDYSKQFDRLEQARKYSQLCGAYNDGWQSGYYESVSRA